MAKQPTCLVCQKAMEPGSLAALSHDGGADLPRWLPGYPDPALATSGVKRSQFDAGLKVVVYRCPECEALRFYAPSIPAE